MANTQARIVNIVRVETVSSNTTITVSEVKVDKATYYGNKRYELVGNTGSVHVVISDRKIVTSSGISADILEVNDYYAWGQEIKSRSWTIESDRYLFGYQDMLRENSINIIGGEGNMYSTEFRMFDARLGRWMSLDPLMDEFPWMSPFVGMDNNPISLVDPLGLSSEGVPKNPTEGQELERNGKKYKFSGGHWVQELKLIVIKKPSWWQKKWAKLTSAIFKVGKKVNNGLKIARRFINESIKVAGLFTLGVGNAHASNNLMGAGRGDASKFGKYKDIVQTGQTVGDLISLAHGTTEVITGATGNAVGVLLDATGVGAVAGVPVNVASTAVAVHGTTVVGTATANIIMDYSGGGSGGGGSESESSGEGNIYEPNSKHGSYDKGDASKAPEDPQNSLDNSFELPGNTTRRVGADKKNNEFNVFDEHSPNKFHGHSRKWSELSQDMKNILYKNGVVNRKGKILK